MHDSLLSGSFNLQNIRHLFNLKLLPQSDFIEKFKTIIYKGISRPKIKYKITIKKDNSFNLCTSVRKDYLVNTQ